METVQDFFNHSLISRPCIIPKCMKLHLTFWKICFKSKRHYWLLKALHAAQFPVDRWEHQGAAKAYLKQTENAYTSTGLTTCEEVSLSLLSIIYYINMHLNCFCKCCCKLWSHVHTWLPPWHCGKWPWWGSNSPGAFQKIWRTPWVMMICWAVHTQVLGSVVPTSDCVLAGSQVTRAETPCGSWLWGAWRGGQAVDYTLPD